jgi:hypothetical protein
MESTWQCFAQIDTEVTLGERLVAMPRSTIEDAIGYPLLADPSMPCNNSVCASAIIEHARVMYTPPSALAFSLS